VAADPLADITVLDDVVFFMKSHGVFKS